MEGKQAFLPLNQRIPDSPFFIVTTALIAEKPRHSLVSSSELSSKASGECRLKSTGKSTSNAESTQKSTEARSLSRHPVQIKLPLTKADPNHWVTRLRRTLRDSTIDLDWAASSSGDVVETVRTLRQLMEEQNTTLAKAYRVHRQNTLLTIGGGLNWAAITSAFMKD